MFILLFLVFTFFLFITFLPPTLARSRDFLRDMILPASHCDNLCFFRKHRDHFPYLWTSTSPTLTTLLGKSYPTSHTFCLWLFRLSWNHENYDLNYVGILSFRFEYYSYLCWGILFFFCKKLSFFNRFPWTKMIKARTW